MYNSNTGVKNNLFGRGTGGNSVSGNPTQIGYTPESHNQKPRSIQSNDNNR